jgi:5-methylcytosine-specific restriction endonuclease McrA
MEEKRYYDHLCGCGCGGRIEIKPWHKKTGIPIYMCIGHSKIGKHHTKESNEKNRIAHLGVKRKPFTLEAKMNMGLAVMGKKHPMWGKHHTDETRDKQSDAHTGKHHTEETKTKMSMSRLGNKNPNWQGGKSFEPYNIEFNDKLKEQIRKRDNYACQECGYTQEQLKRKLDVHHIDYNKKNNSPDNLISLCNTCHLQTNFRRHDWTGYFKNLINNKDNC